MKSVYIGIAFLVLVCGLCCVGAYGSRGGVRGNRGGSECVFLNNLALFANACAVYSGQAHPQRGGPSETANCVACHGAPGLVAANLASFASANAVYKPRRGQHGNAVSLSRCARCHDFGLMTLTYGLESVAGSGAGLYNANSSEPVLVNCTFSANASSSAMHSDASSAATVTNCILWDDTTDEIAGAASVTYSCVQGGDTNNDNITDDPLFVDAANDNVRLTSISPCIDEGTSTGAPATDIRGVPRSEQGSGYDMGAYEYYAFAIATQPQSLTVDEDDPASFSVQTSGGLGSISYQWQWDGADIEDENASIYTIESAQTSNEGSYACLVADDYDGLVSDIATLTVIPETMPVAGVAGLAAALLAAGLLGALRLRRRVK